MNFAWDGPGNGCAFRPLRESDSQSTLESCELFGILFSPPPLPPLPLPSSFLLSFLPPPSLPLLTSSSSCSSYRDGDGVEDEVGDPIRTAKEITLSTKLWGCADSGPTIRP